MEGKYSKLFAFAGRSDALTMDIFRSGFDLDDFLSALCKEAATEKEEESGAAESSTSPLDKARATKNKVEKLLEDFQKSNIVIQWYGSVIQRWK